MDSLVKVSELWDEAMLGDWIKDALKHWGGSQSDLARELTQLLGRSIDRAAVNKMLKGPRSSGGRDLAADEMLGISKITSYPLPGVSIVGPTGAQTSEFQPFSPQQEQRLLKVLTFVLRLVAQTPEIQRHINDPAQIEGIAEVILRAVQGPRFSAVDVREDEAALIRVEIALRSLLPQ